MYEAIKTVLVQFYEDLCLTLPKKEESAKSNKVYIYNFIRHMGSLERDREHKYNNINAIMM